MIMKTSPAVAISIMASFLARLLKDGPETMNFVSALLGIASTVNHETSHEQIKNELKELLLSALENMKNKGAK